MPEQEEDDVTESSTTEVKPTITIAEKTSTLSERDAKPTITIAERDKPK